MKYKIGNIEGLKADELKNLIENRGARVLFFRYHIGLVLFSIQRISAPILIKNSEELRFYRLKYNLLSLLGIFQIPIGIFKVVVDIQSNLREDLEFTSDILYNLDFFNEQTSTIEIKRAYTLFSKLSHSDLKEMKKAIQEYCDERIEIKAVFVGKYINQTEGTHYTIGLDFNGNSNEIESTLLQLIRKRFYEFLSFQFIYKTKDALLFDRLKEQGQVLLDRK